MARKRYASSARGRRAARNAKPTPDHKLDFSDIPESTDQELARARSVGRSGSDRAPYLMAVRLTPRLLNSLRKLAAKRHQPCDALIPDLLKQAIQAS